MKEKRKRERMKTRMWNVGCVDLGNEYVPTKINENVKLKEKNKKVK